MYVGLHLLKALPIAGKLNKYVQHVRYNSQIYSQRNFLHGGLQVEFKTAQCAHATVSSES